MLFMWSSVFNMGHPLSPSLTCHWFLSDGCCMMVATNVNAVGTLESSVVSSTENSEMGVTADTGDVSDAEELSLNESKFGVM